MDQIRWIIYGIYTIAPPPPEKNCPPVRDGVWVKIRVNFMGGGGGNQTIAYKENCPRLRLGFGLGLVMGLGCNFPRGQ